MGGVAKKVKIAKLGCENVFLQGHIHTKHWWG
jgi:hypothetical protein